MFKSSLKWSVEVSIGGHKKPLFVGYAHKRREAMRFAKKAKKTLAERLAFDENGAVIVSRFNPETGGYSYKKVFWV